MNPYLENPELWSEVHHRLITAIAIALQPQLSPNYRVAIEKRTYLSDGEDSVFVGVPDVSVLSQRLTAQPLSTATLPTQSESIMVILLMPEEVREGYLEIREIATGRVSTVIEVLSPTNKLYNMGLSLRTQMYGQTKLSDVKVIAGIKKVLTNHVKKSPEFAWMNELSSKVYQSALQDLQTAFTRYRKGLAKHPTFASRKDGQSFTVYDGNGKVVVGAGSNIKIPTLGTFRLHEPLAEGYVTQTFTVSREGSRWYVSFSVDADRLPVNQPINAVGIDVGVKVFTTLSNAEIFAAPKPLKQVKTKLAQL